MADFIMIVPTRGRPGAVLQLADSFASASTASTLLFVAVDDDDPELENYRSAVESAREVWPHIDLVAQEAPGNMATALNMAVVQVCAAYPEAKAYGFMGDDHRPRSAGWDTEYLSTLEGTPGIVYGNDLIHGANLPTQFAVSGEVIRALGFMSPEGLKHMYIDNYWRDIGRAAQCLTYRGDVVVEHMHPVAAKSEYDEGYARVNDPAVFDHDATVYAAYMTMHEERDTAAIRKATGR
jgi:hypothetical protein